MAARKPPQDSELSSQLAMIEGQRTSAIGGMQALGTAQDSNISNIYGTLRGGLQQGAQNTEAVYARGGQNVRSAYEMGGAQAGAASAGAMSQITDSASRLGMDERALAEVQGKLSTQAGMFANRNQQSSRERSATMAQQGAGMTAISQMAIAAAQQAEAQGKRDLSQKILTEVAKANSSAMTQKAGATGAASARASAAASRAASAANSSARALASAQRSARSSSSRGPKEKDPLDQAIKMMRLQIMEKSLGGKPGKPETARERLTMMDLEDRMAERESSRGESADDIWADISRFQGGGGRTTKLLQDAMMKGAKEKDESGMTDRQHVTKNIGNLNKQVVLDRLARLHAANKRAR